MITPLPKTLPAFFWFFIKKQWKWFALIQVLCFAWSIDHTLWPYIFKLIMDAITSFTGDKAGIYTVLVTPIWLGVALALTISLGFRLSGILMSRVIPQFEANIRMHMLGYVSQHSHNYFADNFAGSIATKINDMPQSATNIMQLIITIFIPALLALVIATAIFAEMQPLFAIILGGWVVIHIGICLFYARKCSHYSKLHSESRSVLSGKIVDSLSNISNIKLFSRRTFEMAYLSRFQNDEQKSHSQALWYIEKIRLVLDAVCLVAWVAINWYTIYCWQHDSITTGDVILIWTTTWNIIMMAWVAGIELPNLFKEVGTCRQALSLIERTHDITDHKDAKELVITKGKIEFLNVSFNYIRNQNIFRNKSVTLEAGKKIGLVGFSGSGKTTFVSLILRYFDIESGQILIDGQDISMVTQDSLRAQIGMIPQDTSLFHRSLMENIRYGRLDATDEEVIEASKKAHCHEFISKLPEGYQALVGERGVKLSGGQRQRIAIARAMLKNAPILILDEATSALDSVTEKNIQESLGTLMQGRTTIVIAHRLSTLSAMDRILVFDKGQVVEDGSHSELLLRGGHYAHLWAMQAGGFLPEKESETGGADAIAS
jgi:ATP-binding cassette, subfamily B, bacterial